MNENAIGFHFRTKLKRKKISEKQLVFFSLKNKGKRNKNFRRLLLPCLEAFRQKFGAFQAFSSGKS